MDLEVPRSIRGGGTTHQRPASARLPIWFDSSSLPCPTRSGDTRMRLNPYDHSAAPRIKQDQCFVIMPFTQSWSQEVWQKHIQKVCATLGLAAVRGDDRLGSDVLDDIWRGISESAAVIVDTTGANPNVMYELGLAHALKKNVILIAQGSDDIPFGLRTYRHVIYQDSESGRVHLERELLGYLEDMFFRGPDNFGNPIGQDDFVLLFLSNGGTCRCAMANMITRFMLSPARLQSEVESGPQHIRPISAGLFAPTESRPFMSQLAQHVVREELGISW